MKKLIFIVLIIPLFSCITKRQFKNYNSLNEINHISLKSGIQTNKYDIDRVRDEIKAVRKISATNRFSLVGAEAARLTNLQLKDDLEKLIPGKELVDKLIPKMEQAEQSIPAIKLIMNLFDCDTKQGYKIWKILKGYE